MKTASARHAEGAFRRTVKESLIKVEDHQAEDSISEIIGDIGHSLERRAADLTHLPEDQRQRLEKMLVGLVDIDEHAPDAKAKLLASLEEFMSFGKELRAL